MVSVHEYPNGPATRTLRIKLAILFPCASINLWGYVNFGPFSEVHLQVLRYAELDAHGEPETRKLEFVDFEGQMVPSMPQDSKVT